MKINELGQIAKREVIASSPFAKLMQSGNCQVDSKSEGDTLHGVKAMKETALKFKEQTSKVAKALIGNSIEETVQNNYNFVYTHFQYEADGYLQQLRSPNCSFAQRFSGIDCKSYSVFVSTLLLNQNIAHIIRRVKQRDYKPSHWSHVYIIVPVDQQKTSLSKGYYVIDGTLHINKETPYIKKHDTIMSKLPYVVLNGAAQNAVSTNFKASKTVIDGFQEFLKLLIAVGVSSSKIQYIINTVNQYLNQGIDPALNITNKGVTIQSQFIPFAETNLQSRGSQRGFGSAVNYANQISENPVNVGLNGEGDDSIDIEEIEGLTEVIGSALDSNFFNNTFGAVFANGMNLSCWNSTFTPQQTSQQVNVVHIPAMRNLFNAVVNAKSESALQTALNVLDKYTANANKFFWHERIDTDWQKCSRQALDIYTEYYREQYPKIAKVVEALKVNFNITSTTLQDKTTIPPVYDHNTGPVGITYNYQSYNVKIKEGVIPIDITIDNPFDDGQTPNEGGTGGGIITPGGNGIPHSKAGFNPVLGLFLVGGAIGTYLYTQSNKEKSSKIKK
ncbi:hypothetical protein [Lacinutrix sp. Hel_I_90]|uniref:hypothetical protein n=1 Tax=Lacinutrix sp. Hel_I_90 TaxID=1249999 RepID=UPI0005CB4369|nr:hypothetical protein [Lacinutrix sp. Hel_I_90]